jgi:hypothetical protein
MIRDLGLFVVAGHSGEAESRWTASRRQATGVYGCSRSNTGGRNAPEIQGTRYERDAEYAHCFCANPIFRGLPLREEEV